MKKRFISCFYCIFSNVSHSFFHKFRRSPRNSYLWQADDYQMRNLCHGYRKTKTASCTLPSRSAGRGRSQAGEERWRTNGAGGRRMPADKGRWRTKDAGAPKGAGGRRMLADEGRWRTKDAGAPKLVPDMCCPCRKRTLFPAGKCYGRRSIPDTRK